MNTFKKWLEFMFVSIPGSNFNGKCLSKQICIVYLNSVHMFIKFI